MQQKKTFVKPLMLWTRPMDRARALAHEMHGDCDGEENCDGYPLRPHSHDCNGLTKAFTEFGKAEFQRGLERAARCVPTELKPIGDASYKEGWHAANFATLSAIRNLGESDEQG